MNTMYTVSRIKKGVKNNNYYLDDVDLEKIRHGSDCGEKTVCGLELNDNWYIRTNTFDGEVTCKKCLKILEKFPSIPERINKDDFTDEKGEV